MKIITNQPPEIFCVITLGIPGTNIAASADGVSDDSAVFDTAFNLCPPGKAVYFPQGKYSLGNNWMTAGPEGVLFDRRDPRDPANTNGASLRGGEWGFAVDPPLTIPGRKIAPEFTAHQMLGFCIAIPLLLPVLFWFGLHTWHLFFPIKPRP